MQRRESSLTTPMAADPVLASLAQLGLYRVGCSNGFVALNEGQESHIVVGVTPHSRHGHHDLTGLGTKTLGLGLKGDDPVNTSNVAVDVSRRIVHDIAREDGLRSHPFVRQHPRIRFYAEVPLYSPDGDILGTYCVGDQRPRSVFEADEIQELRDVSASIAVHLEGVWARHNHSRSDRWLHALLCLSDGWPDGESLRSTSKRNSVVDRTSRGSSEVPELRRLSISTKSTRDLSPKSIKGQQTDHGPTNVPESPFFKDFSPEPMIPPAKEEHQEHVRRCSDELNNRISVSEGGGSSHQASLLFSKASVLLRESLELDGVIFFDAARSNSRSSSSASASDWDKDFDPANASQLSGSKFQPRWSKKSCEPLGFALSGTLVESRMAMSRISVSEGLLHDLFTAYPQGKIFYPLSLNTGTRRQSEQKELIHHTTAARIAHELPEAASVIFFPLWNWDTSRWLAGTLLWTREGKRLLGPEDLAFLRAFGSTLAAEFSRMDWKSTEKSKSDLLGSVSHELRSPLHGMLASAELLQTTNLEPAQRDMVTMVETCGLTLLDTMNYLLDVTKINNLTRVHKNDEGLDEVHFDRLASEFALDTLVEEVTESLYAGHRSLMNASKVAGRYLADGNGGGSEPADDKQQKRSDSLSVILRVDDLDSWTIKSVSGGWRRLVMNLLGNAFKFTRSGFIEVHLTKDVQRTVDGKTVFARLSVTDTGCGMSPDFLEHNLFKPFIQESFLTEGVGLGLSIVEKLITYLGGTIHVKSDVGVGTRMEVCIPLEFASQPPVPQVITQGAGPGARTVTRVCLVGLSPVVDFKSAPDGVLTVEAKRKLSIRAALSNVLLSRPGWALSYADTLREASGDVAVIEETTLKNIASNGPMHANFRTIIVLGDQGVSLPEEFTIENAQVIYLAQPIVPRRMIEALNRILVESQQDPGFAALSPVFGPFPGTATRGRSLSEAFALAKGIESPPVMRENMAEYTPPPQQHEQQERELRVLIVDDNEINIKLLATFMRKIGCSYETATNGLEAWEKYKTSSGGFDYVLMDISMPIMDGIVSSSKIREYEEQHGLARTAIMAVTGVASSTMQQQAFAAGIDDYLVKPLSLHDLKRIMNIA
ncbi:sensor histidine kinase/response regulator [Aspergillus campestris IBT 28561]|uniref:Sensor histidine kinase/response regulator n=1 Tax=Aspergillus campestris (strain IBT 28561) TaxID=1392248 RepID=A0A2I1CXG9_ASPC2|nr:sensor histidine kinase/response regulator [Aspergillus campestris IBT 28561]PKY02327.1 sensor histidine kinase/response regulator [Aspergillus campestris IBT 28561]